MNHWTEIARFWVPGEPQPMGRPRARVMKINGKPTARVYNPTTADGWKRSIIAHGHRHRPGAPIDGAVKVDIELRLPRPQRLMRKRDPDGPVMCFAKPDIDNYAKAIYDAMTDAGWWRDDGQIALASVRKLYAGKGEATGAFIRVIVPVPDPALFEGEI